MTTSDQAKAVVVSGGSISRMCEKEFEVDTLHNPSYLRQGAFSQFLQRDEVKKAIRKGLGSEYAGQGELVEYAINNRHVFFTLVMSKLIRKLPLLWSARFLDRHLPVRWNYDEDNVLRVYSMADDHDRPLQCFVECEEDEDDAKSWDFADVKSFASNQWLFFAVAFEKERFKYEIDRLCPLPYINLTGDAPAGGGFGKVFKLGLQAEHLKLDGNSKFGKYLRTVTHKSRTVYEVAVKQLRIDGVTSDELAKFFKKETHTLEVMLGLHHPHLIQAIAVYERGPDRFFVFPWAPKGNLREVWDRRPVPADQEVIRWAWRQILGLTDGLKDLHERDTRHGDLKPENILMFDGDHESGPNPLVIADVGISKFHAEETRIRRALGYKSTSKGGTLRYEPPEIQLDPPLTVSRKYDSWSLGCVLLEFVIWLMRGNDGLTRFEQERCSPRLDIDRFWDQNHKGEPMLHAAARRWINQELAQDPRATPALRDLLGLVDGHLLAPYESSRAEIQEFCRGLHRIHNKCSTDPSYLWNLDVTELTIRRESTEEVAGDFVVPISQRRTSVLVDKWETVRDPSLVRELLEGLRWTQWPGTTQLTTSSCHLCRKCAAVNFASQSYELQRSLQDLHESAGECVLCGFLDRRLSALEVKPQGPLRLIRVGAKIQVYPVAKPIISLYCDPVFGSAHPSLPFAQLGLPLLPEAASLEQFALLKVLVHHCDEKHKCMAVQEPLQPPSKLPTRVIDVGGDDGDPIRLVETSQDPAVTGRYVALSHRWGDLSQDQRFCTYADNIAQRKERIEYDELPASFRDAVRVARALGVRFLWIDSLCIIQEDPEDWAAEAGRMEQVFSHAYCTIAASSAESSLAGFLGGRRPRDAIMLPTPEGSPLYLGEDIDDFRADVENSVLSSRGWVLQERALSRRTIYFTSTQVYWECGNGVVCETLAQLRNPQSQFLGDNDFPSFGLQFYKDERIRLVQHFYTAYSALSLSHASDRSQAVAGLQSRIAQAFNSEASYGVLWRWSQRTLLWYAAQPETLTRVDYHRRSGAPPSWSWMAYDGHITFMVIPFAGVEWTENVRGLPDAAGDGRVSAEASGLQVSGEELMARAMLDMQGVKFVEDSWKCVLIGKKKSWQEDDAVHYVLLIRRVDSSGSSDDLYERVGVAVLLASHLSLKTSPVFIV